MPLLDNIINRLLEGLTRAGQMAKESTAQQSQLFDAIRKGQKTDLGPLIQAAMAASQPMSSIAGQITPQAFAKMAPEAQSLLGSIMGKFPKFAQKVQAVPRDLMAYVQDLKSYGPGVHGVLSKVNPLLDELRLGPKSADIPTAIHELQHHINVDKLRAMSPEDAGTIGLLLHDVLSKAQQPAGSLRQRIGQYAGLMERAPTDVAETFGPAFKSASPEAKAVLTTEAMPKFKEAVSGAEIPSPYAQPQSMSQFGYDPFGETIQKLMGDEGLAYLSEASTKAAPQSLLDLAQQLGVGVE